jgi:hypothetical protein
MEEACAISNRIAPEHLEVSAREPQRWEPLLKHAGAIFLGAFTSESLGDYCAGPNHVLPTAGTARFSSPLGVYDFQKRTSVIEVSERGAASLGPIAADARARRRARGACARRRAAARRRRLVSADAATPGRYARVIRQDVRSMHAYAIQAARAWSSSTRWRTRSACPRRCSASSAEGSAPVAINRYPTRCVGDVIAALAKYVDLPPAAS